MHMIFKGIIEKAMCKNNNVMIFQSWGVF